MGSAVGFQIMDGPNLSNNFFDKFGEHVGMPRRDAVGGNDGIRARHNCL